MSYRRLRRLMCYGIYRLQYISIALIARSALKRRKNIAVGFLIVLIISLFQSANAYPGDHHRTIVFPNGKKVLKISGCVVKPIDEIDVPAHTSGPLVQVVVIAGLQVKQTELLARIDDSQARVEEFVALRKLESATLDASTDVNIEFARKSEELAYWERQRAVEANRQHPHTIVNSEIEKLEFSWERAKLQVQQAIQQKRVAQINQQMFSSQSDAATLAVARCKILAPWSGQVVEIYQQAGEWVTPGTPIVRIVRLDKLRVTGYVDARQYHLSEVVGRVGKIEVTLARGQKSEFLGKVVFANPQVEGDGKFAIWFDVDNRMVGNQWILVPGYTADLSIEMSQQSRPTIAGRSRL